MQHAEVRRLLEHAQANPLTRQYAVAALALLDSIERQRRAQVHLARAVLAVNGRVLLQGELLEQVRAIAREGDM